MAYTLRSLLLLFLVSAIAAQGTPEPTQVVEYDGYLYATLGNSDPASEVIGCDDSFTEMPDGWSLVEFTPEIQTNVARSHGWGTHVIVYANGDGYMSSNLVDDTTTRADMFWENDSGGRDIGTPLANKAFQGTIGMMEYDAGPPETYRVWRCNFRILIRRKVCYDAALHCEPGQVCLADNTCADPNSGSVSNFNVEIASATLVPAGTGGCTPTVGGCWKVIFTSQASSVTFAGETIAGVVTSTTSVTPTIKDGENTFYFAESSLDGHSEDSEGDTGPYSVTVVFTFTDTVSDRESADVAFSVNLAKKPAFGAVSTAGSVSSAGLVQFTNARLFKVSDSDPETTTNDEAFYASLTFLTNTAATTTVAIEGVAECVTPSIDSKIRACGPAPAAADFCVVEWSGAVQHTLNVPLGTTAPTSDVKVFDLTFTTSQGGLVRFVISVSATDGYLEQCTDPYSYDVDVMSQVTFDITTGIKAVPSWSSLSAQAAIDNTVTPVDAGTASIRSESIVTMAVSKAAGANVDVALKDVHIVWEAPGGTALDLGSQTWVLSADGFTTAPNAASLGCAGTITNLGECAVYHQGSGNALAAEYVMAASEANLYSYLGATEGDNAALDDTIVNFVTALSAKDAWFIHPFAKGGQAQAVHIHALFEVTPTASTRRASSPRRMLLQTSASPADGVTSASVRFDVTPAAFTASVLGVPRDFVTAWEFTLAVTAEEVCLPAAQLMDIAHQKVRSALVGASTAVDDVQVSTLSVDKNGLSCAGSARRLLSSSSARPSVTVETLVVFEDIPGVQPSIDKSKLAAVPGILSMHQTESSSIVEVLTSPPDTTTASDGPGTNTSAAESASSSLILIIAIVAASVAVAVAVAAIFWGCRWRSVSHNTHAGPISVSIAGKAPEPFTSDKDKLEAFMMFGEIVGPSPASPEAPAPEPPAASQP